MKPSYVTLIQLERINLSNYDDYGIRKNHRNGMEIQICTLPEFKEIDCSGIECEDCPLHNPNNVTNRINKIKEL